MGSGADYLREMGLECVNQGDIPDSWDDNHPSWNKSRYKTASKQEFADFNSAREWAQANPGKAFVRNPNGNGFIEK